VHVESLETRMIQLHNFMGLEVHFGSLGTGMIQQYKFRDRSCILLIMFYNF
jgi:hypothetical protein